MNAPSPRRWFRFSLRTLLVLVTLVACWLGWESSVVRHRQAIRKEFDAKPGIDFTTADSSLWSYPPGTAKPRASVPLVRRLLGDEPIQEIWMARWFNQISDADVARLTKAFPEATIQESHPEPCHPGCFPRGTLVETPSGHRAIESIAAGDAVTAFLATGEHVTATVQSVFITDNRLWLVSTEADELVTTETQPLCLATDRIVAAGQLQAGDKILRYDGGALRLVKVTSVTKTRRVEEVVNLVLGDNQLFIAGGFLARSKPPRHD